MVTEEILLHFSMADLSFRKLPAFLGAGGPSLCLPDLSPGFSGSLYEWSGRGHPYHIHAERDLYISFNLMPGPVISQEVRSQMSVLTWDPSLG